MPLEESQESRPALLAPQDLEAEKAVLSAVLEKNESLSSQASAMCRRPRFQLFVNLVGNISDQYAWHPGCLLSWLA